MKDLTDRELLELLGEKTDNKNMTFFIINKFWILVIIAYFAK